ncbi:MAG: 16S rRNA (cytosine(1402)-N(4))-methyltransferase RsmH [Patescibacteria group bacterium]
MHTPVLLKEVLEIFKPEPGKVFVDGTANGGGHTNALRAAGARVIAIELDPDLAKEIGAIHGNYADIATLVHEQVDGVLLDLGFSSQQLESGRGFSFKKDEPLDMRYNYEEGETAADILNTRSEEEIAGILKEYGDERFDGRIASAIVKARPLRTTYDLVNAIVRVVPRRGRIHPATRTFQALRIAVNHELENLQKGLEGALKIAPLVAVITFHSLEDRIVKKYTKKKIKPSWEEIKQNRRARSAKLRVVERTTPA